MSLASNLEALFENADYSGLVEAARELEAARPRDAASRHLLYRFYFLVDDLARVEREVRRGTTFADRWAAARLRVAGLDFAAAEKLYRDLLDDAKSDVERARTLHGLGHVLHRQRRFDEAHGHFSAALELTPEDPDLLVALAHVLLRLARVSEAIDAVERAVRLEPWHEGAHYLLGNGYARKTYRQLESAAPTAMKRADERILEGSRAFEAGRLDAARGHFKAALEHCPEHGRAHNGLARTLEAQRLAINVHRPLYERRFEGRAMPEVPEIERFVLNWAELAPRHRKEVALAIAPWRRYVPVLLAGGATFYVKPLQQKLSESPGQELLRHRRIDYDARLWDDVRGCGGYRTVTGIEDVERAISNGYNTVLHELTHQVHWVLPEAVARQIEELYRRALERDEAARKNGGSAFLSRYAGVSVWEYLAEGAHALASPRRDRFDGREIVRERFLELDPELAELIVDLEERADVEPCYAAAYVNRGNDHVRHGRPAEALPWYRRALESGSREDAASSLVFALQASGAAGQALEEAREHAAAQPESATLALALANARWLANGDLEGALAHLEAARERVREDERFRVDQRLGALYWTAGDAAAARRAHEAVLRDRPERPEALWGLAAAHALAAEWDAAWQRYAEAIRARSGVVGLRAALARDLLRAGETERARREIAAALELEDDEPEVLALAAREGLESDAEAALVTACRALELGPWCDEARFAAFVAARRAGDPERAREILAPLRERLEKGTPPSYVYRPERGRHQLVHTLPAVLRRELHEKAPGSPQRRSGA